MKILIHLSLILVAPYFMFVYWRNSMRELNDIHAEYELKFE